MEVTSGDGSLEQIAREHAVLRRMATLVASEPPPDEVFTAVAREAGLLLGAQRGTLLRVVNPGWAEVVASWSDGMAPALPVGHCAAIEEGRGLLGQMLQTARPVRIEDFDEVGGVVAALMRELGVRSGVGGPIVIGGRVWGAVTAAWPGEAHRLSAQRTGWPRSPNWWHMRFRTLRPATSWRRRALASSRPRTRRDVRSNATFTTALNNGSWSPRSS